MKKSDMQKKAKAKSREKRRAKHEGTVARQRDRRQSAQEFRLNRMFREKQPPAVNGDVDPDAARIARDIEIHSQLDHNLEILRALEEEMDREDAARLETNARLEQEGSSSLREKMETLHREVVEQQNDASVGGTAEVSFRPNPTP